MLNILRLFLFVLLVVVGSVFTLLNTTPVTVNYFLGEWQLSLPVLLFVAVLMGTALGLLLLMPLWVKVKAQYVREQRRNQSMHRELDELRKTPVSD